MHFAVSVFVSVAGIASLFGPSLAQAYWPIIAFLWFSVSEQQVDADQRDLSVYGTDRVFKSRRLYCTFYTL